MIGEDSIKPIDAWFESQTGIERECYFFLRKLIPGCHPKLIETWKYRMPIYCVNGKMCCYVWKDKKTNNPYVGFIPGKKMNHPQLEQGSRMMIKIFPIDPAKDIPVGVLTKLIRQAVKLTGG